MLRIVKAFDVCQSSQGLEYNFKICSGRVHSIKINSLAHRFSYSTLKMLSYDYKVPLFLDLKLYDTPETIKHYIRELSDIADYLTITYANNNETSLAMAFKEAKEYEIKLFIVSMLSSAEFIEKDIIIAIYRDMCKMVAKLNQEYATENGVVIPKNYIGLAKYFDLKTLTPGLMLDNIQVVNYKNQVHIGTVEEAFQLGGDLFVLGRNFPTNISDLDKLNKFLN
jgi:orotidine-5'-phosphate decarboxylase